MQEKQVTLGKETFALPQPFLVLTTQNPRRLAPHPTHGPARMLDSGRDSRPAELVGQRCASRS
ncbi:MAG: hypothetical protein EA353_01855 [Puniceicoccaceae bacterium]|nr:MAG: hypothetical protein EA353_01855 [Puniceicoccaceae bacterium]